MAPRREPLTSGCTWSPRHRRSTADVQSDVQSTGTKSITVAGRTISGGEMCSGRDMVRRKGRFGRRRPPSSGEGGGGSCVLVRARRSGRAVGEDRAWTLVEDQEGLSGRWCRRGRSKLSSGLSLLLSGRVACAARPSKNRPSQAAAPVREDGARLSSSIFEPSITRAWHLDLALASHLPQPVVRSPTKPASAGSASQGHRRRNQLPSRARAPSSASKRSRTSKSSTRSSLEAVARSSSVCVPPPGS